MRDRSSIMFLSLQNSSVLGILSAGRDFSSNAKRDILFLALIREGLEPTECGESAQN